MTLSKPKLPILQRGHPLARGLIGAWLAYEGAGLTARDVSGRGNDGTLQGGVTWMTGQDGPVLLLDSADDTDWVEIADNAVFNTADISLVVGIKRNSTGVNHRIFARGPNAASAGHFDLYINGDVLHFNIPFVKADVVVGTTTIDTAEHTAAYTRRGNVHTLYLDGEQDGQATDSTTGTQTGGVRIGVTQTAGDGSDFDGQISYAFIFSQAFSASQIRALYADPYQAFRPRRAWYPVIFETQAAAPEPPSGDVFRRRIIVAS